MACITTFIHDLLFDMTPQREKGNGTREEAEAVHQVAATSTEAGAKTGAAAVGINVVTAGTARAATGGVIPEIIKSTGRSYCPLLQRNEEIPPHLSTPVSVTFISSTCSINLMCRFPIVILHGEQGRKRCTSTGMCLLQALSTSRLCSIRPCKVCLFQLTFLLENHGILRHIFKTSEINL